MKKQLLITLCTIFSLSAMAVNLGTVNIQKVLVSTKDGKAKMKSIQKAAKKKEKIFMGLQKKMQQLQHDYQKQSLVMSEKAKIKKQEEMKKIYMTMEKKKVQFQKELQKMEQKFKLPMIKKIKKITEKISKKLNVDITFEISTAPIIYAKNAIDLTDKVIKAYDKK